MNLKKGQQTKFSEFCATAATVRSRMKSRYEICKKVTMEFLLERDCNASYLTDYLKSIYDNETAFDMFLLSDNVQFKVHRSVLAAASQFFNYLLKDQLHDDLTVSIVGYRYA